MWTKFETHHVKTWICVLVFYFLSLKQRFLFPIPKVGHHFYLEQFSSVIGNYISCSLLSILNNDIHQDAKHDTLIRRQKHFCVFMTIFARHRRFSNLHNSEGLFWGKAWCRAVIWTELLLEQRFRSRRTCANKLNWPCGRKRTHHNVVLMHDQWQRAPHVVCHHVSGRWHWWDCSVGYAPAGQ